MTGERLKKIDVLLIFITFIGVTLITCGFYIEEEDELIEYNGEDEFNMD